VQLFTLFEDRDFFGKSMMLKFVNGAIGRAAIAVYSFKSTFDAITIKNVLVSKLWIFY